MPQSADWQWSIAVKGGIDKAGPSRAFLWIPPNCQKLRGLILAQHNMEEISILENPKFRRALGELDFAEIWCAPPFDHLFRFNEGAGDTFNGMMEDLAKESGYEELKFVPVIGIGHSAAASWPYYFAAWNPDRALAAISVIRSMALCPQPDLLTRYLGRSDDRLHSVPGNDGRIRVGQHLVGRRAERTRAAPAHAA